MMYNKMFLIDNINLYSELIIIISLFVSLYLYKITSTLSYNGLLFFYIKLALWPCIARVVNK